MPGAIRGEDSRFKEEMRGMIEIHWGGKIYIFADAKAALAAGFHLG